MTNIRILLSLFLLLTIRSWAYKPVFIIHGILAYNSTMIKLAEIIDRYHPGTKVYVSSRYCGWQSLLPLNHQIEESGPDLLQVSALHPEGFHLIGYSQGGLLARAILQKFPEHRVRNFISLSSPQAGQYGNLCKSLFILPPWLFLHEEDDTDSDFDSDVEFKLSLEDPEPWLVYMSNPDFENNFF